ncbi:hypothetical protein ACHQM5_006700 [Ranunculus cassubicifolius]
MGISIRASCLLLLSLGFFCNTLSEARDGKKQLPSALVVGTVHCDTCSQQVFSKANHFISGASVAVKCGHGTLKSSFYQQVKTDKHGVFQVLLPTHVSKHLQTIKGCSVKLVHSSDSSCAVASSATSSTLGLMARKEGTHIFSSGVFTFKPLKQPEFCNQKQNVAVDKEFNPSKALSLSLGLSMFPPMPTIPTIPNIPTLLPTLPVFPPSLPPLTPLPTLPAIPKTPTVQPENTEPLKGTSVSDQQSLSLNIPGIPAIPATPAIPVLPTFPNLPTLPFFPPLQPTVPGLLPTPGIPPVTGFPGIPPATSTTKTTSP